MSTVRTTFPENRFAKLARQPGGLSLTEALSRAQANLDSIRDESAAYVDARLGEIDAALGGDGSRVEDEALRRAYGLANDVVGVAGACGLGPVGEAAYSLYWNWLNKHLVCAGTGQYTFKFFLKAAICLHSFCF